MPCCESSRLSCGSPRVQEHGETVRVIKLPPAARRVLDLLGIPIAAFADDLQGPRP